MKVTLSALIASVGLVVASPPVHACSPDEPGDFAVDMRAHADDLVAPSTVEVRSIDASYYEADSDCFGDHWNVDMFVDATDYQTASEDLGFLVLEPEADPPTKLAPDERVEHAQRGGRINRRVDAGKRGEVVYMIYAVDFGGNVSPWAAKPVSSSTSRTPVARWRRAGATTGTISPGSSWRLPACSRPPAVVVLGAPPRAHPGVGERHTCH